jgi:hypothetical protein
MARITVKIPLNYKKFLFSLLTISWVSGILFFILKTWFLVEGEFGPEKHPLQQPLLMLHGASAFLLMISYGALITGHVPSAWKLNRSRYIGITLVSILSFQIISAYMLYYLANESLRDIIAYMHLFAGISIPFILTTHIIIGIKRRTSRS